MQRAAPDSDCVYADCDGSQHAYASIQSWLAEADQTGTKEFVHGDIIPIITGRRMEPHLVEVMKEVAAIVDKVVGAKKRQKKVGRALRDGYENAVRAEENGSYNISIVELKIGGTPRYLLAVSGELVETNSAFANQIITQLGIYARRYPMIFNNNPISIMTAIGESAREFGFSESRRTGVGEWKCSEPKLFSEIQKMRLHYDLEVTGETHLKVGRKRKASSDGREKVVLDIVEQSSCSFECQTPAKRKRAKFFTANPLSPPRHSPQIAPPKNRAPVAEAMPAPEVLVQPSDDAFTIPEPTITIPAPEIFSDEPNLQLFEETKSDELQSDFIPDLVAVEPFFPAELGERKEDVPLFARFGRIPDPFFSNNADFSRCDGFTMQPNESDFTNFSDVGNESHAMVDDSPRAVDSPRNRFFSSNEPMAAFFVNSPLNSPERTRRRSESFNPSFFSVDSIPSAAVVEPTRTHSQRRRDRRKRQSGMTNSGNGY
jgi:hypothetical protein